METGDVSKVAPTDKLSIVFVMILAFAFLGEAMTAKAVVGSILILGGTLFLIL